ncbi:MAG: ABC transporter ATP-binding protein [Leptolyngbyaceae cyanobacterium SM2_5_2]|nr:ABC transporter ATP-binding protein [Leptolyngbyaceae cyanobacterium SM2_5_2]
MTPLDILRLDAITKRYTPSAPPAVEEVSLTLQPGEILALLGPSGCGKTTLLRLIAGFERPDNGTVYLGQQPMDSACWLPPERRDVGIVFQDYALFPHLTVEKNVAFGLQPLARPGGVGTKQIQPQAEEAIALVGLSGLEKRFPHELSGGQQQRVALARALAPRPSLILLDEPFSNLDVQVRLYLRQEVRDILKRVNASGIFVTHDQEEALAMADRIAVMHRGRVEQVGTPEEIYTTPASRFIAEFVTQANFVPAHRQDQGWASELGYLELPAVAETVADGTALTHGDLMIRQEDLHLEIEEDAPLVVRQRQFLGREYKYCLTTPRGQAVYARLPAHQAIPVGCCVRAVIQPWQVRLYPPQSQVSPTAAVAFPQASAAP